MQVNIVNASVEYGGVPVLTQADFCIREKDKIALVGRNGCGKTTLLRLLAGEVEAVAGFGEENFGIYKSGDPSIGFLKQTSNDALGKTMHDEILEAYGDIISTEHAMEQALIRLQEDGSGQNVKKYSALHDKYEHLGGYLYKKEYLTAVRKFGFTDADMAKPLTEFSGGQRTKIALLKLLLSKPDILLLDEPTNHLDLEAIEWLESYLSSYRNACVIVSHDRMFLDKIVNVVYEIENGETVRYNGNYSAFTVQKKQAYDKAVKDTLQRKKEIERLSALVERFRYKASKAAMAQSKIKQIERLGDATMPHGYDNSTFRTSFQPDVDPVEKTVVFDKLTFGYGSPLGSVDTVIKRGQKVGIIGRNGCGKSTLVKTLMRLVPPIEGTAYFGLHTKVGYFDQTKTQSFSDATVMEDMHDEFPMLTDTEVRSALGAFLFTGDDVFKRIGDLSGGEKVRLALCKIFKKKPNVLILDEPTNHMDIIGKETLESMLAAYTGTVITVSHDRYFINRICDRLIAFDDGGVTLFEGKYSEYEEMRADKEREEETVRREVIKKTRPVSESRERARREHRRGVLEQKMRVIEDEIQALNDKLGRDPDIYTNYKKVAQIEDEIDKLKDKLSPFEEEWMSLID